MQPSNLLMLQNAFKCSIFAANSHRLAPVFVGLLCIRKFVISLPSLVICLSIFVYCCASLCIGLGEAIVFYSSWWT